MVYRPPQSRIVPNSVSPTDIEFYYIGATNGNMNTRLFGPGILDIDDDLLSATQDDETDLINRQLFLQLFSNDVLIPNSMVDFNLTVIGNDTVNIIINLSTTIIIIPSEALTVLEKPSDISTIFHRFSNESINFTCNAAGTGTQLQWFYNAVKINNDDSNLLIFDKLSVNDSGVYQCFWEESDDEMFALDTWALAVQQPGNTIIQEHSTRLLNTIV